jgi:hypothetical protein
MLKQTNRLNPTVFHLWILKRMHEGGVNLNSFTLTDADSLLFRYKLPKQIRKAIIYEMVQMKLIEQVNCKVFCTSSMEYHKIENISLIYKELGCFV